MCLRGRWRVEHQSTLVVGVLPSLLGLDVGADECCGILPGGADKVDAQRVVHVTVRLRFELSSVVQGASQVELAITAAPLWKLFGLKPWQKKLQETWKALEKGEYD